MFIIACPSITKTFGEFNEGVHCTCTGVLNNFVLQFVIRTVSIIVFSDPDTDRKRLSCFTNVLLISVVLIFMFFNPGKTMTSMQGQIQQDWNNREFVEVITSSIKKIAEFLNAFDLSARSRLAALNQKLTALERQVDYIEARVARA